ncbi:hypothetical protein [Bacillus mojavensis]|uniref:hypothetical protein n=1 Tax=Bacillus mojavensis TaxID=72360 RepID=UPI002DB56DCE|nr:hypothetical protein [Bacillus mojavensis]MEC1666373.1 hypothetical protein [Bacillus mojavensis]
MPSIDLFPSGRITGAAAPGFLVSKFGRISLSAAARASGCLASISSFSYRITGAATQRKYAHIFYNNVHKCRKIDNFQLFWCFLL